MKRKLIFLFVSIIALHANAVTRRALIIGIGDYPATSGWTKINGDKDIPLVEETLTANSFLSQYIVTLKNEQATCAAIKAEFEKLISKAVIGDYIYIHFSGHGQQITDLNGDEEDGLDEAWIPYDAQLAFAEGVYEGQNHLIDDQLNSYLHRLRQKVGNNGKIIMIADACHSGSGSRAETEDQWVVRGTADIFVIPNTTPTNNATPYPIQWTFISACKDYQCNQEYRGNGSLTYALYLQRKDFAQCTTKQLCEEVKKCINNLPLLFPQTPELEYDPEAEDNIFL